MITARRIALTAAVAVYLVLSLAGFLALSAMLSDLFVLLLIPAMMLVGSTASDMIGEIWQLEGQYDDNRI